MAQPASAGAQGGTATSRTSSNWMTTHPVTVGYQDGALHPLWISTSGMRIARLLGASAIWVPDHFMGFAPRWMWVPEIVPAAKVLHSMDALFDPVPLLTLAALKHRKVWLGTSVTEPIRRHPMSLAQTFVTLDHISRGRAILGIGNGLRENTEPYGLPTDQRVNRLDEALRIIRMLWASGGKPVDFSGKFWTLKDAVFDLPLYRGRRPRIFLGAHFPRMLRMCGRYADGWLPGQKVEAEQYRSRLETVRDAALSAGRSMNDFVPGQTLLLAFGSSRQQVLDLAIRNPYCAYMALGMPPDVWKECGAAHPLGEEFGGFLEIVPSRIDRPVIDRALAAINEKLLERLFYMGTPSDVLAQAAPLAAAGCRHFILANMGGAFTGAGLSDFARMGKLIRGLKRLSAPAL
jgi:phthiodiolone/phenolphthiodiolone dimycocerosates ketoreductase